MSEKEICLVIGGEGFLGGHLVNQLLELRSTTKPNLEIRIFDLVQRKTWPEHIKFYAGDLCSFDDLSAAMNGVVDVYQTASPHFTASKEVLYKVNVEGNRNLIEVCKQTGVKNLIFSSSCSVVFDGTPLRNVNEDTPASYLGEQIILKANSETLKTCSLRLSGLFGPGDQLNVPGALAAFDRGMVRTSLGDNTNLFDYTYIENSAYAHVLAAEKLKVDERVAGQAFFITNGTPIPFFNHMRKILTYFGAPDSFRNHLPIWACFLIAYVGAFIVGCLQPIVKINWTLTPFVVTNATTDRYFDITKARTLLEYEPKFTLEEGQRITARWFLEKREKEGIPRPVGAPIP